MQNHQNNTSQNTIKKDIIEYTKLVGEQLEDTIFSYKKNNLSFKKKNYIYQRAAAVQNHFLLQSNTLYAQNNRRPPKKYQVKPFVKKTNIMLKQDLDNRPKDIKKFGHEQSVRCHYYDDYAPMSACVDNLTALYVPQTLQYIRAASNLKPEVGKALKADIQAYLNLTNQQRAKQLSEMMTVRYIEKKDTLDNACDEVLIGQRGVFARHDIARLSIIGIYAGIFLKDELDMIKLIEKVPIENIQDYLFRIPMHKKFPKVSAYQYGNRLSIINAATNYSSEDIINQQEIDKRANIMVVTAKTNECTIPEIASDEEAEDIVCFVAGRDIPKGEQLFYDYGKVYW